MRRAAITLTSLAGAYYYVHKPRPVVQVTGEPYQELSKAAYASHPNKHFLSKVPETIGIIGGGVAGLCTAKELLTQGYAVEVLEKNSGLGGVWFENYADARLQGHYTSYLFPDFGFPEDVEQYPKLPAVKQYLQDYSDTFQVTPHIQFNAEVASIQQNTDQTWSVTLKDGTNKLYDFLVLATGLFSNPYIPKLPNADKFQGVALHAVDVKNPDTLFKNKRVVIVGGEKSGRDIAVLAMQHAQSVTMLARNIHYHVDDGFTFLGKPYGVWVLNRLSQLFAPSLDNHNSSFIYDHCKPLCQLYYNKVLRYKDDTLPPELRCTFDMQHYFPLRISVRETRFTEGVRAKKISVLHTEPTEFTENGVNTSQGHQDCEVVVFCTGHTPHLFDLTGESGEVWMYRNMLVPHVHNLAVMGMAITVFTPTHFNLQAVWLCEMLRGTVALPSVPEMEEDIRLRKERFQRIYGERRILPYSWIHTQSYLDMLLEDMGVTKYRKSTLKEEWLEAMAAADYKTVVTHRI